MIATRQEVMRVPDLKKSYSRIPDILSMPHLIDVQTISFRWFEDEGLRELFEEFSPIQDFTSSRMELRFGDYRFGAPKYSMDECRERDLSYSAPLKVNVQLVIKETGEVKEQELFFGDFPLMTPNGTFVINGAERVVVAQLMRSPGAYFTLERDPTSGRQLCYAKLIPNRGAWLEFETTNKDVLYVKVDRRRKLPATILLRAADQEPGLSERELGTNERLSRFFTEIDGNPEHHYIQATTEREPCQNREDAVLEFYRRMRPGDPPTRDSASALLNTTFFNPRRYDMGQVGRYKVNKRLRLQIPPEIRTLTFQDVVAFIGEMIRLNNAQGHTDDIDHLGNRRVRAVGELIQNAFRVGLLRMERAVRERMSITDPDQATPSNLVNIRPVAAAIREFFGASQLSQFMDQTNPLAELTHKRRVSALGPGGLSRERAGFEVRDVHHSHYGRICPIETPEGPNIGLIGSLATYGRVNRYGFIETPYRQVIHDLENTSPLLAGHILRQDIQEGGTVVAKAGDVITAELAHWLASRPPQRVPIQPVASTEIAYLPADEEESYVIAQANTPLDADGRFLTDKVECRVGSLFRIESPENIGLMDVSPKQVFSVAASLIPFLEHDDANRALMGSNMQRQAVPLLRPEAPLVCTGLEEQVARDSGQVLLAGGDGTVTSVSGNAIRVRYDDGQEVAHRLIKFMRSNQGTCINQRPIVDKGQRIRHSQALADSSSTDRGQLALGQALLCAFMSWEGYNFEDAIIVTDALAREDKFTSVHIEKYEVEARDTKLGPEEITRDIPNVGEEALRNLDEEGIIRMGAEVQAGDILVGKITPKGETELTAEEKLLRAIFGEKARDVKDTSLRVPHGEKGKVIDVKVFRREDYPEMPSGVLAMVRVQVAQRRKLSVGDKMAARHGNKGVISKMLPLEDMPYLTDGMPIEVILNP
ncbi:MAG TPA: DNA-directed RNA polymerase subunit beta, partial [Dehalococcoidia bacterium]|nr:DNA-directed RNA polymerase subunit beta [Dehalococcoidia bacterium]